MLDAFNYDLAGAMEQPNTKKDKYAPSSSCWVSINYSICFRSWAWFSFELFSCVRIANWIFILIVYRKEKKRKGMQLCMCVCTTKADKDHPLNCIIIIITIHINYGGATQLLASHFASENKQTNEHECAQMCNHSLFAWRVYTVHTQKSCMRRQFTVGRHISLTCITCASADTVDMCVWRYDL